MQDQYLPSGTGDDSLDTPVDLNAAQPVQHFAFGGIANPGQRPMLRGSDREYLEARQKELDAFEKQRLDYNNALTKWQTEVYNPYKTQVDAYNTAAQKYNTEVYDSYKAQVDAYNAALTKYNEEVYSPYATQYAAYEKAVNDWNAGSRESDYAGPAAPTLARNFEMTMPTQPEAFGMTAPTAPEDFKGTAPVLPFKEEEIIKYQQEAASRAQKDAANRATALEVVSNPDQFNFGSLSVANRFMAKGGPVEKSAREMLAEVEEPQENAALMRMLSEVESGSKMDREAILAAVEKVAAAGRGGDELLAYLSPKSMTALKRMGGAGIIQRQPSVGFNPISQDFLRNLGRYDPVTRRQTQEERDAMAPPDNSGNWRKAGPDEFGHFGIGLPGEMRSGYIRTAPGSNAGIGPIGNIGGITIRGPATPGAMPDFGSPRTPAQQASSPSNFFGLNQPAAPGMNPGTVSTPYNPLAMYQGPSPVQAIANNPNLSPQMLGGQQNAGMMTDRLGNRIYAPGTPPAFMFGPPGFAKGGEADIAAMRALVDASNMAESEDQEEVINTDPVGSAKGMLSGLMAQEKPRAKATGKVGRMPATGGGAETPKEMALQYEALMSQKDIKPKAARSAQAELRALAKSYRLKKAAAENAARGLMSNTLGAPTLEKPTLEQPTLTTRRFAEGGEAKKAKELEGSEGSDGPSASALLRRLGLAVARGVPQAVTGLVDLAALPLTATGRMKAEDVVGTTDYLTKRGLLPKPQEGLASESAELLSSMASPGGAAKAAVIGLIGPKGLIEAARRSTLFKGPGMTVPEEKFSSAQMLKMLEEQGIDTNRMWLRGKKEDSGKTFPQMDYDTLGYLYNYQKRPDAVEAALRDSRRSQATQGRTLSRQPGDRSVTKFNTKGGVWLTDSPNLAQTYAGERGYVIPVYAPKPDVKLDAKGEQWEDFYRKDKDWKEAFADPKVRLVEVRNIIDAGTHWPEMISPEASEEELRALLTATNLFAKKPFEERVVNKLTGEPFEFKHGGSVSHAA